MWKTIVTVALAAIVAAVIMLIAAILFSAEAKILYEKNAVVPLFGCLWACGIIALSAIGGGREKSG